MSTVLLFAYMILVSAFVPFSFIRKEGPDAIIGGSLLILDIFVAYYSGRFALLFKRYSHMPGFLCGFGMIVFALLGCAIFNFTALSGLKFIGIHKAEQGGGGNSAALRASP